MVIIMELKKQMEQNIYDMEKVAQLFDIEPFDIYLLGGSACILGVTQIELPETLIF